MTNKNHILSLYTQARQADYHRALLISALPGEQAQAWAWCIAVLSEWREIATTIAEPMVAAVKLAWWREALEEMREGNPARGHPLLQTLPKTVSIDGLLRLIENIGEEVEHTSFESEAAWRTHYGTQAQLVFSQAELTFNAEVAEAYGAVEALVRLPRALQHGWLPLSDSAIENAEIADVHEFVHDPNEAKLAPTLEALAKGTLEKLNAISASSTFERRAKTIAAHRAQQIIACKGAYLYELLRASRVLLPLKLLLA